MAIDEAIAESLGPALFRAGIRQIAVRRAEEELCARHGWADIVFLDARVREVDSLGLLSECESCTPRVPLVVFGDGASQSQLFKLAQAGATAYLGQPLDEGELRACVFAGSDAGQRLRGIARCLVGEMTLKDVQKRIRDVMLEQALESTRGSRRSAARLLGVTRPAVQRMLREQSMLSAVAATNRRK